MTCPAVSGDISKVHPFEHPGIITWRFQAFYMNCNILKIPFLGGESNSSVQDISDIFKIPLPPFNKGWGELLNL